MEKIIAVKVSKRTANAPLVQDILTKYGCNIRTRIGFHEASVEFCSADGIVMLQLVGEGDEIDNLFRELNALDGVIAKYVDFE